MSTSTMLRSLALAALALGLAAPATAQICDAVPGPGCPCSAPVPAPGAQACDGTIPDGVNQLTATLTVPSGHCGGAAIDAVGVRVAILHPSIGDLTLTLTHPGGTSVVLLARHAVGAGLGDCVRDDLDVTFADQGASPAGVCQLTIPALAGTVRPASPLAALAGLPAGGQWTLTVQDAVHPGAGALRRWGLDLTCPALPVVTVAATAATARAGGASGRFTITRDRGLGAELSVDYTVTGTAAASLYAPLPGSVVLPAGAASATVDVIATAAPSTGQTVVLTLSPGGERYAVGNPDAATVTIAQASCGDGLLDAGEECDDGNDVDTDGCLNACRVAVCGDAVMGPGEQCDDGNADDSDFCLTSCLLPRCGDGVVSRGEECDDGNLVNDDACSNACLRVAAAPSCGDGVVGPGEQCDDGNSDDSDFCLTSCLLPRCGDGVVSRGEECDDGNLVNDDACSNSCQTRSTATPPETPADDGCGCRASGGGPAALGWGLLFMAGATLRRRRRIPRARNA